MSIFKEKSQHSWLVHVQCLWQATSGFGVVAKTEASASSLSSGVEPTAVQRNVDSVGQICDSSTSAEVQRDSMNTQPATADSLSSGLEPTALEDSVPAVGQICGIHRDGRLDVVWVDGSQTSTYLHHCYVITDEACAESLSSLQWTSLFTKTGSKTDRGQTTYTRKRSTHNTKITKMHTNIEHSPERLTRHCEWHLIYDKTQI